MKRRTFLSRAGLASGSLLLNAPILKPLSFKLPMNFTLKILATNWGFGGSWDEFCSKAKAAGYDGIEVWIPGEEASRKELLAALEKYQLEVGFLTGTGTVDFKQHLEQFQSGVRLAAGYKPLFINCHSGRDYFTFEQGKQLINFTTQVSKETGVPIYHESHRGRLLYAAHVTRQYIEQLPDLRLTLDISHWCNVHESLLGDQEETVALALDRTEHIHSRVGHPEGPQVNDPRAPEWADALKVHFDWWDTVVKRKSTSGGTLTMTTEFGPPTYMPALPYTQQPLGDQWAINVHMKDLWRERYSA